MIGRDAECEVRLADAQVSRRHAVITAIADGVRVTDLDSRHGTIVNGERLTRPRRLLSGDVITQIGSEPVRDAASFRRIVERLPSGTHVPVRLLRGGQAGFVAIRIED